MNVKSIFVTLITIVACVLIGAIVLNVLLPNVTTGIINAAEDMIYNATGISFDFNGDKNKGTAGGSNVNASVTNGGTANDMSGNVTGFNKAQ